MVYVGLRKFGLLPGILLCACSLLPAQQREPPQQLNESGQILVAGHATSYLIRHLPVSSFPGLPEALTAQLNHRGCLIPQTYEAHRPERGRSSRRMPRRSIFPVRFAPGDIDSVLTIK